MLVTMFSAKGSPGVTSSALVLAAVWPRPVALLEADPTGSDLVYRCRSSAGGPVAPSPNLLSLAAAVRGDRSVAISQSAQRLANGVELIAGVTTPAQSQGIAGLWRAMASAAADADVDVIADVGRFRRDDVTSPLVTRADLVIPVVAGSLESLMHTRELLKDVATDLRGRVVPVLVGRSRTAKADCEDVDEVLAVSGVLAMPAAHIPLDRPGLSALEVGVSPTGRGRLSHVVRGARSAAAQLLAAVVAEDRQ